MAGNFIDPYEQGQQFVDPYEQQESIPVEQQQAAQKALVMEQMQQVAKQQAKAQQLQKMQQMKKEQSWMQSAGETGMDALTTLNSGVERTTLGTMQLAGKLFGAVTGADTSGFQNSIHQVARQNEVERNKAYARSPAAAAFGDLVGSVGGMAGVGAMAGTAGGAAGLGQAAARVAPGMMHGTGVLANAARGAAIGGAEGYTQYAADDEARTANTLLGSLLGGSLAGGMRGAQKLYKEIAPNGFTRQHAQQDIMRNVEPEKLKQAQGDLRQLNDERIFMTPGEATGSPMQRARESRYIDSDDIQEKVAKGLQARDKGLKEKFFESVNSIVREGDRAATATRNKLYSEVYPQQVPEEVGRKLISNPKVQQAVARIQRNPDLADTLSDVQPGTIGYYDKIKRTLDSMINAADRSANKDTNFAAVKNDLIDAAKAIRTNLDEVSPKYKMAREVSERLANKQRILEDVRTIKLEAGQAAPTADQLYQKFFSTTSDRKDFMKKIVRAGGDVKTAEALANTLNRITKTPLKNAITRAGDKQFWGFSDMIHKTLRNLVKGEYNDELIQMTFHKDLGPQLKKISSIKNDKRFLKNLGELLSKANPSRRIPISQMGASQTQSAIEEE